MQRVYTGFEPVAIKEMGETETNSDAHATENAWKCLKYAFFQETLAVGLRGIVLELDSDLGGLSGRA